MSGSAAGGDARSSTRANDVDLWARIADLDHCIARLSAYIERLQPDELPLGEYTRLLALHGGLALALLALSLARPAEAAVAAVLLAAATGAVGLHTVLGKIGPDRRTAALARLYARVGWPVRGVP